MHEPRTGWTPDICRCVLLVLSLAGGLTAQPAIEAIQANSDTVGLFEKFELTVEVQAAATGDGAHRSNASESPYADGNRSPCSVGASLPQAPALALGSRPSSNSRKVLCQYAELMYGFSRLGQFVQ